MNLYNLKYFVDTVRLQSMTKAAELNNLSRPAISQAIQKLEQELDTKLLVHKRRTLEFTDAGTNLFKRSEPLLVQIDDLKNDMKSSKGPVFGEFKVGSSRSLATFNLPPVMSQIKKSFANVDFKVQLANSDVLVEKLSQREIDIAYFIGDETLSDFKNVVIKRGSFCLLKPKNLNIEKLEYAITERRPETERLRVLFERNFSKSLPVFSEIQSWDAIWTWVNEGICGGLVPDFMLESKPKSSRNCEVVLPKVFPYEIKVLFPKTKINSPVTKEFVNLLSNL